MTEKGEYPLVFQKELKDGVLIPVGLAEASSLTFQTVSATTISATNYVGLPTFGGDFTGIQNVQSTGAGSSVIDQIIGGDTLVLKNIYVNLDDFMSFGSPGVGDPLTLAFNQPLTTVRGGTGTSVAGNTGELSIWGSTSLTSDPSLNFNSNILNSPNVKVTTSYYVNSEALDLKHLDTVDLTTPPTDQQILRWDDGAGWIASDESNPPSLPAGTNQVIYNNGGGTASVDATLTFNDSTKTLASTNFAANSITEGGTALSTKYQAKDTTLDYIAAASVPVDGQFIYFAGSPVGAQLAAITPFTLSILDDANAAGVIATLGLGALSLLSKVDTDQIIDDAVNSPKIKDDAVTLAKLQNPTAADRLLGSNDTTIYKELSLDSTLRITGGSVAVNPGNVTITDLGGTLSIAKGGTGQTTANAALNALLPSQSSNNGKYLKTDGTNTSWADAGAIANTIYKQVPQTIVSDTSDSDLTITTNTGSNYKIKYYILVDCDGSNTDASLSANIDIATSYDTFRSIIKYIPPGDTPAVTYRNIVGDNFNYGMNIPNTGGLASFEIDCTVSNITVTSLPLDYSVTGSPFNYITILEGSYVSYNTF